MTTAPTIPGQNPVYEDYARCVHCGLCLNACPTYRLWNLEADSPRGRIHQMIQVAQSEFTKPTEPEPTAGGRGDSASATPGRAAITASFVDHIDKCLDCRACETACPSAVEYGKLVEHARAVIERDHQRPLFTRIARNLVFRKLLPHPRRIAAVARVLRFYQRSGLQFLARASGILKLFGLAGRERLLPLIDDSFFFSQLGRTFPATGKRRARVAFFAGCVAQVTFTRLNLATIRVLTANGCEVVVPPRSSVAAPSLLTRESATPPEISPAKTSRLSLSMTLMPSSPMQRAADPRLRNTIISFRRKNPNASKPSPSLKKFVTSPSSSPTWVSALRCDLSSP